MAIEIPYLHHTPSIPESVFVADSAQVMGNVTLGEDASVWFQCLLRGDVHHIAIGEKTNVQDGTIIHVSRGKHPTEVHDRVTLGHRVTLHGCVVERLCLIGIGAIVLDGAVIGEESIVAAGALVPPGMKVPPRSMVMGVPGRVVRGLSEAEIASLDQSWKNYVAYKDQYLGR